MKFSVLLSVYKNEKPEYLRTALKSIIEQTLMPDEIVIVQDGQLTDDLEKVLAFFKNRYGNLVILIPCRANRGLGLALRDGVTACSNEYIARMDTDDIANPRRFEIQMAYLEKHPDIAVLGSWVTEFSGNPDKPDTITKLPCLYKDIINYARKRNPFRHMTIVLKKSAVVDSGNYRDFLWFEDYDLWIRMIQKGYLVENISSVLVNVRADDDMFARRGGWVYLKQDIKFQKYLYDSNFIGIGGLVFNIAVRSFYRLLPKSFLVKFYRYFLRSSI